MDIKFQLIELLEQAQAALDDLVSSLSEKDRQAVGEVDRWAPKDLVAHVNAWNAQLADWLSAVMNDQPRPDVTDYEGFNQETFYAQQHTPLELLMESAEDQKVELVSLVSTFSESDLAGPLRYDWREGRPLWRGIAGTGFSHTMSHISEFYRQREDLDKAILIEETAALAALDLSPDPDWQAAIQYNLACFYAKIGDSEKAVPLLADAFALRPDLVAWARKDSDLDPLRDTPQFNSLLTSAGG